MSTTFTIGPRLSVPMNTDFTTTMDVGTNPVAIGVIYNNETVGWNWCTVDGQSAVSSHIGYGSMLGTDVGMYWNNSLSNMSGTVDVAIRQWTMSSCECAIFVIHAPGAVTLLDTEGAGTAGYWHGNVVDSGVVPGYALTAGTKSFNMTANESRVDPGWTNDGEIGMASLEDNAVAGSRTVGTTTLQLAAYFTAVFSTGDIYSQPDPVTQTMTAPAPTVSGLDVIKIIHSPITQTQVVPEPSVIHKPQRAIPTVGIHAETPGRLAPPSGLTTPVLSYVNGEPVWVESTSLQRRPRRLVMRPGITDPPEPVANPDGDDYVYMEYDD